MQKTGSSRSLRIFGATGLAVLLLGTGALHAATFDYNASQFNTLFQNTNPNTQLSGGASVYIFAGTNDDGLPRRGLIQFDLSSIPSGATVTSASLSMVFDRAPGNNILPASIFRVNDSWGQGTSPTGVTQGGGGGAGAPSMQNDASWLYRFYNAADPASSLAWTNPGGDFAAAASATVNIQAEQGTLVQYQWTGSGVAGDVQAWVKTPSSNFGWIIEGDETQNTTAMRFQSPDTLLNGQGDTPNGIPFLSVTYSVPEPSGVGVIFLIAGIVGSRRRIQTSHNVAKGNSKSETRKPK